MEDKNPSTDDEEGIVDKPAMSKKLREVKQ
jgi:hypothetical protein